MCFSAMVDQGVKELGIQFKARVRVKQYMELAEQRIAGRKLTLGRGFELGLQSEPEVWDLIEQWHGSQVPLKEKELFKQKARLDEAERRLMLKTTKKAQEEKRISSTKIKKLTREIKLHQDLNLAQEDDLRVYPMGYLSMITLDKEGERAVVPARYHMRPFGQKPSFDRKYNGCYNARRDNLGNPFWKPVFGRRHGLIVLNQFYENVTAKDYAKNFEPPTGAQGNLVLRFDPGEPMLVPVLWDVNRQEGEPDLISCALITDEPPQEVSSTGHDRCPIFLKEEHVDQWLRAKESTIEEHQKLLGDPHTISIRHQVLVA